MTDANLYDIRNPIASPAVGTVVGVVAPNDPESQFTSYTYEVELHSEDVGHVQSFRMPPMPFCGESSGGDIDFQDPLLVGQTVLVSFIEGDPRKPFILCRYSDGEGGYSTSVPSRAEYPKVKKTYNGVRVEIDKEGSVSIQMKAGQSINVKREDGTTQILRMNENGNIDAGVSASVKKLVTEEFISVLKAITDAAPSAEPFLAALKLALGTPTGPTSLVDKVTTKLKGE